MAVEDDVANEFGLLDRRWPKSERTQSICDSLAKTPGPEITWALCRVGDRLAQQKVSEAVLKPYEAAVNNAPYATLHAELGDLLLRRAGLELDLPSLLSSYDFFNTLLCNPRESCEDWDTELIRDDSLADAPVMPELRNELIALALRSFSSAYGSFTSMARKGYVNKEYPWELFVWAVYALDGMRLIFQETGRDEENEAIYWNFHVWHRVLREVSPGLPGASGVLPVPEDAIQKFSYSLGLARGSQKGHGLAIAEGHLRVPIDEEMVNRYLDDAIRASSSTDDVLDQCRAVARNRSPDTWDRLPEDVQDVLSHAEFVSTLLPADTDWSSVIFQYCRAVDIFLDTTIGAMIPKPSGHVGYVGHMMHYLAEALSDDAAWKRLLATYPGQEWTLRMVVTDVRPIAHILSRASQGPIEANVKDVDWLRKRLFNSERDKPSLLERLISLMPREASSPKPRLTVREAETLDDLLAADESAVLEFKSSLRWDHREAKINPEMEREVARAVAGMMNFTGGTILLGVADEKTILGLKDDMKTLGKKQNRDGFELRLRGVLERHLGAEFSAEVNTYFEKRAGKEICVMGVLPAPKPVFFAEPGKSTAFFVRDGNATKLLDAQATNEYVNMHWPK